MNKDNPNYFANTPKGIVDLNTAVKGQELISCHGEVLTYIGKECYEAFLHRVEYADGSLGSRTDDGFVADNFRLATDHDIVFIVPLETTKRRG